jgi:hypothetical protein
VTVTFSLAPTKNISVIVGVVKDGLVPSTFAPEPVELVTPVPPLATGNVPVTPVLNGKPVQLVNVPEDGVPRTGVVSVGLVRVLLVRVCVPVNVVTTVESIAIVTAPVAPETVIPVPATLLVTPVLVIETAPVALVFVLKPLLVVRAVTPALVKVTVPPNDTAPPPDIPVPAVTVIELLAKLALVIPAVPLKLLLVKPLIVFEPAAIVLLVRVSVVALPTSVSDAAGKTKVVVPAVAVATTVVVPEVDPLNAAPVPPIVGRVRVLLVKVSEPANVAKVPVVGNVTEVVAVAVSVVANAPEVVKLPPNVIVLPVFATPVPPY